MIADPLLRRSPFLFWAFGWYLRWYFWRRFHAVRISRAGLPRAPAGRPLIVYSNHPSWWDPALYILLCTKCFPGRPGFGPMDVKALGRYGVLERMGVFGIDLDTGRGAARFLDTSLRALADPAAILWITAEGAFTDPRRRPIRLRAGIAHLARRVPGAVILPLAIEYTFWNESRPEALVRFGAPIDAGRDRSVAEWTAHLETELTRTMDALTVESAGRDPALFQPVLRGGAGVGGIYDLWRRTRAWAGGRRFEPAHEPAADVALGTSPQHVMAGLDPLLSGLKASDKASTYVMAGLDPRLSGSNSHVKAITYVMAGLDPAIHAAPPAQARDGKASNGPSPEQRNRVDHRIKSGDDVFAAKFREPDSRGLDPATHAVPPASVGDSEAANASRPEQWNRVDHRIRSGDDGSGAETPRLWGQGRP